MAPRRPRRRPVVELYERIVNAVRDNVYPPGSTLPSEPALATAFSVERTPLLVAKYVLPSGAPSITVRQSR
ncbi:GntR family transcriptional regulator [Haloechinothrix halophila]|uniref:GntR family transcriptional regulator n=1 Tax=Haloechinothrix halophila TaxID=1069073 RepID=UPI0004006A81|nr:GntR family transcriptional regulator [Haloechinothrix halophila]